MVLRDIKVLGVSAVSAAFAALFPCSAAAQSGVVVYLGAETTRARSHISSRSSDCIKGPAPSCSRSSSSDNSTSLYQAEGPFTPLNFSSSADWSYRSDSWMVGSDSKRYSNSTSVIGHSSRVPSYVAPAFATPANPSGINGEYEVYYSRSVYSRSPVPEGATDPVEYVVDQPGVVPLKANGGGLGWSYYVCRVERSITHHSENSETRETLNTSYESGSYSRLPHWIIYTAPGVNPIPAGMAPYLSWSMTYYRVPYGEGEASPPVTKNYGFYLNGLNGGGDVVNPNYMAARLPNNSCIVYSWSNISLTFRTAPPPPPAAGQFVAASAGTAPYVDPDTGIYISGAYPKMALQPSVTSNLGAYYAYIKGTQINSFNLFKSNTVPAWIATELARNSWIATLMKELAKPGQSNPPQPICAGYSTLAQCLTTYLTIPGAAAGITIKTPSASPTPTPTPKV